jgi:hypothetical protein
MAASAASLTLFFLRSLVGVLMNRGQESVRSGREQFAGQNCLERHNFAVQQGRFISVLFDGCTIQIDSGK